LEEKLSEAEQRIQEELSEIVDYLDREVVPNVRAQSSRALRKVADKLQNLATYMDEHSSNKP
jgi:F0F1-type ATP synthase membrane subunit b/b'